MNEYFNENMTSAEAGKAFFSAIEGKTDGEIEVLKKEYFEILAKIHNREVKIAQDGWAC